MKVTLIGPVYPYRGGIAHYNASLAQALSGAGHAVRLISFRRQYPSRLYPGESDKDPSSNPLRYPAEYLLDPLFPWTWLHAARSILKDAPDLLLIHWWTTFWAPAYACLAWLLRRKVKLAFLVHNVLPHEAQAWDRWMAGAALRRGQAFIVQAPHERARLAALVPTTSLVIECPHPAYQPFGNQPIPKIDARRQLGLPTDRPLLLFFGIVRPYKGLKYLVEALPQVRQPVHLVVAGEFWEDIATYRQLVEVLDLSQKVTLLNRYIPNEEAHQLFSAADGLVAPYVGGTQSGAAGLALGYGLPMIVTDIVAAGLPTGTPKPLEPGLSNRKNGYAQIVPSADSAALAQAIEALLAQLPGLAPRPYPITEDWTRLVKAIEQIAQAVV